MTGNTFWVAPAISGLKRAGKTVFKMKKISGGENMRIFEGRVAKPACATLLVVAALAAAGCASQDSSGVVNPSRVATAADTTAAVTSTPEKGAAVELTGATFVADGETPRLLLTGTAALSPTVYSREDGKRVVIDLPNTVTVPGMEPPRAPAGTGSGINQITMRTFTELGEPHVQFELAGESAVDASLQTEPGSAAMAVRLTRKNPIQEEAAVAAAASAPIPQPEVIKVEPVQPLVPEPAPVIATTPQPQVPTDDRHGLVKVAASGKPATRLTSVDATHNSDAVEIKVSADGALGYEAFLLVNPPRYVIDIAGTRNNSVRGQDLNSGPVNKVRVSQFRTSPDPVTRLVFDLNEAVTPAISNSKKGLVVSFPAVAVARVEPAPKAGSFEAHEAEDAAEPVVPVATVAAVPAAAPVEPHPVVEAPAVSVSTPAVAAVAAAAAVEAPRTVEPVEASPAKPVAEPRTELAEPSVTAQKPALVETEVTKTVETPATPSVEVTEAPAVVAAAAPAPQNVSKGPAVEIIPESRPAPQVQPEAPVAKVAKIETPVPPAEVPAAPKLQEAPKVAVVPQKAAPAKPAARRDAEDRSLIEAAEALIAQQEAPRGTRDLSNPYEARYMGGADKQYTGEPITLNLKDADVKDTLQKFSDLTGLNIVLDPQVSGTVTVSLTDIPWDQALELILKINGLGYVLEGNVMRIAPTSKLASEETQRQALIKAQEANRPLRTIIQKLSYAKGGTMIPLIKNIMTARGDAQFDTRSNSLIIKELPENVPVVLDLIRNLDTPPQQVMIEARIVEAKRQFSEQLGINWSFTATANNTLGNTTNLLFPNSGRISGGVALPAGTELISFTASNILDSFRLNMALSAAENRGLAKIISSPKIQAAQGQIASIQSGTQVPIQTTVNNTTTVTYVDATTRLEVTPTITAEGTIVMDISIQRREPLTGVNIVGGTNVPLSTRDAKTQLLVRDGGTAVIGGIMKLSVNNQRNMVPGLWKVPLLGNLFRNRVDLEETDELMIFITPRIMKNL